MVIIGLEAFTVRVQWEPAQNHDLGQTVEGTYLLLSLPGLAAGESISLVEFETGSHTSLYRTVHAAFQIYEDNDEHRKTRTQWSNWYTKVCPQDDLVVNYMATHNYRIPLVHYMMKENYYKKNARATPIIRQASYHFNWPELLAVANASVQTSRNRNRPPPITYLNNMELNDDRLSTYRNECSLYYTDLKAQSKSYLINILSHKVTSNGEGLSTSSKTKEALVQMIFDWDGITLQNMLRPLLPQNEVTVNAALEYRPYMNEPISIRNEIVINRAAFECFGDGKPLSIIITKILTDLLNERDVRLCNCHTELNHSNRYYHARQKSIIVNPAANVFDEDFSINFDGATHLRSLFNFSTIPNNLNRESRYVFRYVFFPIWHVNELTAELLMIDMNNRSITLFDPLMSSSLENILMKQERVNQYKHALVQVFSNMENYPPNFNEWQSTLYNKRWVYDVLEYEDFCNLNVFLVLLLDMLLNDVCPVFHKYDLPIVRRRYAYSVMWGTSNLSNAFIGNGI
jgi:hypothetical protein